MIQLNTPHVFEVDARILAAGQPTDPDFATLAAKGFGTIINLRSEQEMQGSQEALVAGTLGLDYIHIPVAGPGEIDLEHARRLHDALALAREGRVLIHCGSSNRVGALLALRAYHLLDMPAREALAYGERAGLTGLSPHVAGLLDI